MHTETLVDAWQRLLAASSLPWVLFEHGTCLTPDELDDDSNLPWAYTDGPSAIVMPPSCMSFTYTTE